VVPGGGVRSHVDQQGLRRRAQPAQPCRRGNPLGLCRPGIRRRDQREFSHRSVSPLGIRRLQTGSRFNGARVWPLFSDANLLFACRLSYRPKPLRSRAARVSQLPDPCNLEGKTYKIFGHKGKQVRDNIHSLDVVRFIGEFIRQPRIGEVYNLGGGRENSISILEAFDLIARISGKRMLYEYVGKNRTGDHICYISDLSKMKAHYPL
jgi:hypothetical protein